jgi:hypothetical protein
MLDIVIHYSYVWNLSQGSNTNPNNSAYKWTFRYSSFQSKSEQAPVG